MIDVSASDVSTLKLKVGKKCMLAYKQLNFRCSRWRVRKFSFPLANEF